MKSKIMIIILLSTFVGSTFAQTGSAVVNKINEKKRKDMALNITTANQNSIANKRLTDEKYRFNDMYTNKVNRHNSELVKTGRKDPKGNEIIYVTIKKEDEKATGFILKPDFEDFPMAYLCFDLRYVSIYDPENVTRPGKNLLRHGPLFLVDTEGATFYTADASDADHRYFVKTSALGDQDKDVLEYSLGNTAMLDYTADVARKQKNYARQFAEFQQMWKAAYAYNDKVMSNVGTKKYDQLMSELKSGDVFLRGSSHYDSLKINYVKDAAGKVTEIQMHFPFIDNKYYDKDKFKIKVTKNAKGIFELNSSNVIEYANLLILGATRAKSFAFIPFEGSLLIMLNYDDGSFGQIYYAIVNDITNQVVHNVINSNHYFVNDLTEYKIFDPGKEPYQKWWMQENLETSYLQQEDEIFFSVFLKKKYFPAIFKK